MDEWQYITLCDYQNFTYDFKIEDREEAISLIIAVSQAAKLSNETFFGMTNRKLIASYFTRAKLRRIAGRRKLTVH